MALAPIDLALWFSDLGIVYVPEHNNQLEFFDGIQWDDATTTYDQYEFFNKLGGRYQFFLQYGNETNFYAAVDDNRIYNYYTFYKWAHESFVIGPSNTGAIQGYFLGATEPTCYDTGQSLTTYYITPTFYPNGIPDMCFIYTDEAKTIKAPDGWYMFDASTYDGTFNTILTVTPYIKTDWNGTLNFSQYFEIGFSTVC